jgi:uncharacterized protein YqeY
VVSLFQAIRADRLAHRIAKNNIASDVLSVVLSDSSRINKEPEDQEVLKTIQKIIENNEIALRSAFSSKLSLENDCLSQYLPKQLSDIQIRKKINELVDSGIKNVGMINKIFITSHPNMYNGKNLNRIISEVLS